MASLLSELRHNPLLWLLVFVPVVFVAQSLEPEAHTLLFVLSVLAIVPLATLLSHATESVAAKTGDTVGGLLNATLGNLTELVIALAALRAGQYMLVKASIAGAIVTNALFMLGASFLLGGLKYHVQEFNRDQRPSSGEPAVPGHDRVADSVRGQTGRWRAVGGVHAAIEPGVVRCYSSSPTGSAWCSRSGHIASCSPRRSTDTTKSRHGRLAWRSPRWPASRCWWRW